MNVLVEQCRHWSRHTEVKVIWRLITFMLAAWMGSHLGMAAEQRPLREAPGALPVRGLHLSAPAKKDLAVAVEFIRDKLPGAGVNTLVLEFDYQFDFKSRPEFADSSALGKDEVQLILKACRENQIELIPQLNCLGHQTWGKRNVARHALGMMQTTWCGFSNFAKAYGAQESGGTPEKNSASESAACFVALMKAMREKPE